MMHKTAKASIISWRININWYAMLMEIQDLINSAIKTSGISDDFNFDTLFLFFQQGVSYELVREAEYSNLYFLGFLCNKSKQFGL